MLTVYKASAGSGKTYRLAYEYIKDLLGIRRTDGTYILNHPSATSGGRCRRRSHSHILAITFTNKATAEMKSRIIRELDRLASPSSADPSAYAKDLCKELNCDRQALAETAGKALRDILNDYSAFNVSTIDSFFQNILRNFAREIDRQGDFRLELSTAYVVGAAVSMLLDEANDRDGEVAARINDWLLDGAMERMRAGTDFNPFNRGSQYQKTLTQALLHTFDENFARRAADVADYLADPGRLDTFVSDLKSRCDFLTADLAAKARAAIQAVTDDCGDVKAMKKFVIDLIVSTLDGTPGDGLDDPAKMSGYLAALKSGNSDAIAQSVFKKNTVPAPATKDALCQWFEALESAAVLSGIYKKVIAGLGSLRAISYIDKYINDFRRDNNMILLSDTNALLRTVINGDETPFIYERLGVELRNFLIDEFQDTSVMQWDNLRPLVSQSLDTDDSLIIGDVKQSIYRWRGADSSLLGTRVADVDFPGNCVLRGDKPGENTNYRSAHLLVRFNNTLFTLLAGSCGIPGYAGVAQSLPENTAALTGYVRLNDLALDPGKTVSAILPPDKAAACMPDGVPDVRTAAFEIMAQTILDQHRRGYPWRSIAILFRNNKTGAEIARFLIERYPEIRIVSEESLMVASSPSVRLIVSILEIIDKAYAGEQISPAVPEEPAAPDEKRPRSFKRLCEMLADRYEYFVAHGEESSEALHKALDDTVCPAAESLADDIAEIRRLAPANLPALVEAIISRKIPADVRAAELPYITAFTDLVNNFAADGIPTVHAFLKYWESVSAKESISCGGDADAVSLLTVHKAKGLEWDCVHIPAMDWDFDAEPGRAWFDLDTLDHFNKISPGNVPPIISAEASKVLQHPLSPFADQIRQQHCLGMADNTNVAYVAFTRAVRELHVNMMMPDSRSSIRPMTRTMLDAINGPAVPDGDIYCAVPTQFTDGSIILGAPTEPLPREAKKTGSRAVLKPQPVPPPPFAVEFTNLNRQMTCVDDLSSDPDAYLDNSEYTAGDNYGDTDSRDDDRTHLAPTAARDAAATRGTDLHAILSLMNTIDDLDDAVDRIAPAGLADGYRDMLRRAFEAAGDTAAAWFDPEAPRVLNEHTIHDGRYGINKRPDRVVWTSAGTVDIIDYKFTATSDPSHAEQVRRYASLLAEMGIGNLRGFVWYPLRNTIDTVSLP